MNTQNILSQGSSILDIIIDNSEVYDIELVVNEIVQIDLRLDSSEFYDYTLGDSTLDYIYIVTTILVGPFIITEDDYIIETEDNYYLEYTE